MTDKIEVVLETDYPEKVAVVKMPDNVEITIRPTHTTAKIYREKPVVLSNASISAFQQRCRDKHNELLQRLCQLTGGAIKGTLEELKKLSDERRDLHNEVVAAIRSAKLPTNEANRIVASLDQLESNAMAYMLQDPVLRYHVCDCTIYFQCRDNHQADSEIVEMECSPLVVTDSEYSQGYLYVSRYFVDRVIEELKSNADLVAMLGFEITNATRPENDDDRTSYMCIWEPMSAALCGKYLTKETA